MFYKDDTRLITLLNNVYQHLQRDYDYLLVVVGDTGVGKSVFALQLLDTWYRVILRQSVDKSLAVRIASDYRVWIENFRSMGAFEMNVYDEGATTLESRQHMTRLSGDLTKLFNVFRSKRFFSVIVLPNFFYLNKYFRENRLRGLVWVDKRGHYRFFTKKGIQYLNAYNERRLVKSMSLAYPVHRSSFPDYKGVLLKPYLKQKNFSVDVVLDEVIGSTRRKVGLVDFYLKDVLRLKARGFTTRDIADKLDLSKGTVHNCFIKGKTNK